jgi:hypothetical protein
MRVATVELKAKAVTWISRMPIPRYDVLKAIPGGS